MGEQLDDFLLGLGDCLVALCGYLYCPGVRGRTIKEYVFGVLFVPPLLACLWIGVFGGAALHMELNGTDVGLAAATQDNITVALFEMFELMPFTGLLSVVAMLLIFIFLVTSADSASYIVAQMTDNGSINPPLYKRVIWGADRGYLPDADCLGRFNRAAVSCSAFGATVHLYPLYDGICIGSGATGRPQGDAYPALSSPWRNAGGGGCL